MKLKFLFLILFIASIGVSFIVNAQSQKIFYNVKDFGAKGDGTTIDSGPINNAIDAASNSGGGTIYFPPGTYASYTIRLKSNISLFIDQGAIILGAEETSAAGYDAPEPKTSYDEYQDFGHNHWKNSLIWGEGLHDISIVGQGLIWGKKLIHYDDPDDTPKRSGNKAIGLKLCRNVNIRDISILHGGHFAILATGVDNLTLDNLKVDTDRDGLDIDCCKNVHISNCRVNSPNDDAICLKSSFALGYTRATENVTIANCQVSGYDEGTLLDGTFRRIVKKEYSDSTVTGRIKFGTESNGGFKNITITNCLFDYSRGLALETVDGGLLEDIIISNITMRDITNSPIFIRLGARMRGPDSIKAGGCRRIILSNIIAYNVDYRHGCIISGLQGNEIVDLQMSNIRFYFKGGGSKDVSNRIVPEYAKGYPEPFEWQVMPAYGFFFRHVRNLKMHDVEISFMNEDKRPPFILDDVWAAELHFIKAQKTSDVPTFILRKVQDINIHQIKGIKDVLIQKADKKEL
ncbi:MAG: glycoside hydrolase family 28 protein [Ginsengibacter sp.]